MFGLLTSGLIRLAITAATLALVYFFLLKPILETTESVGGGGTGSIQQVVNTVDKAFAGAGGEVIKQQIEQHFQGGGNSDGDAQRLSRCVRSAGGDTGRIQRCVNRLRR